MTTNANSIYLSIYSSLIGLGKMWDPTLQTYLEANEVLERHHLSPIKLAAKEGLSLINGTQFMSVFAIEALLRAEAILQQALITAAMSIEALKGTHLAFDERVRKDSQN